MYQKITDALGKIHAGVYTRTSTARPRSTGTFRAEKGTGEKKKRERGERGEKFILKWALPNGAARRTLEPARPGSDELRSWPVARESRRDRKRRGWIKKPWGVSIIAIPVKVRRCARVHTRADEIDCVRARRRSYTGLFGKSFRAEQVGRIHSRREKARSGNANESSTTAVRRVNFECIDCTHYAGFHVVCSRDVRGGT